MKIRNGFVSNSSSSSFICEVCGDVESGMDADLSDFNLSECINHHIVCNCHLIENTDEDKKIQEQQRQFHSEHNCDDEGCDRCWYCDTFSFECNCGRAPVNEHKCPICSFLVPDKHSLKLYLLKKYNITENDLKNENDFKHQFYILNLLYKKYNITEIDVVNEIKNTYTSYKKFNDDITQYHENISR